MPSVNQTELARLLGVSKPYIHKLVSKGILTLDDNGELDVDASVEALKAVAAPGHQQRHQSAADTPLMAEIRNSAIQAPTEPTSAGTQQPDPAAAPSNYQQARAMREKFAAMNERLKFQKLAGELVPAAAVEQEWTAVLLAIRTELMQIPNKLAINIKTLHGIEVDQELLADPINAALNTLAGREPTV